MARRGIYYGWVIVAVMFLVLLLAAGLRNTVSVLIKPLEADFAWDRATISLVVSVNVLAYGLSGPITGRFFDRVGPRGVAMASIGLMVTGALATTAMSALWQFHAAWGLAVGFGSGGVAMVMAASIASRWFVAQRGLVTGILGAGASAGQLVMIPIVMMATVSYGWRAALLGVSLLLAIGALPLVALLLRNSPADVGLTPYGAKAATGEAPAAAAAPTTPLRQAVRTYDFWLLSGSFFVCGWTAHGTVGTHFVPYAIESGFPEVAAAAALALMGLLNFAGSIASGWLCDRVDPRRLLGFYYGSRAAMLVMLPFVNDMTLLSVFSVMYGLSWVATVAPTATLTADRFGKGSLATIFGWVFFAHQIGSAIAAYYAGALHVYFGDYHWAFLSGAVVAASGVAFSLSVGRHGRRQLARA